MLIEAHLQKKIKLRKESIQEWKTYLTNEFVQSTENPFKIKALSIAFFERGKLFDI